MAITYEFIPAAKIVDLSTKIMKHDLKINIKCRFFILHKR